MSKQPLQSPTPEPVAWRKALKKPFLSAIREKIASVRPSKLHFIAATRHTEQDFWTNAFLGRSLAPYLERMDVSCDIRFENKEGLPSIYNDAIIRASHTDIVVLLHDDVWLRDKLLIKKIKSSLAIFDVVGVAGNIRRIKKQPAWIFHKVEEGHFITDYAHLSGGIQHGTPDQSESLIFGPSPARCELIDGVFVAFNRQKLLKAKVTLDPIFAFHFYDMDLCRSARAAGLRVGTWPIELIHQSSGVFGNPAWERGFFNYIKKWEG